MTVPEHMTGEADSGDIHKVLPRAQLLVHGGDLAYPNPTGNSYRILPLACLSFGLALSFVTFMRAAALLVHLCGAEVVRNSFYLQLCVAYASGFNLMTFCR